VSDGERFHRDDPKRTHPRRNMSGILRSDDPWRMRPSPDERREFTEGDGSHPRSEASPRNDGMEDAYRVADENLRDGQQWRSNSYNQQGYDWRSASYGYRSSGYGAPRFGPAFNSPFGSAYGGRSFDGLLEQMVRTYMDMMGLVGTMINGLTRPGYPQYSRPFEGRRDAEPRNSSEPRPRVTSAVRIEVISSQPNEVALDLKALPPGVALSIPPLRSLNSGGLELNDIRLQTEGSKYVLRVRIPDSHPGGLYSGLIVETRSGEPCGTIAVRVGQPVQDRTRARPAKKG